ncbi:phosphatidylserine/phosphatidylglycerophosphate/cardiolipin synthase family protein [Bdellovibrio sp. 22V]|uniref:phospholipase D-like domain-containing protein n=1 Tax=Bdellovibrio TaxID=958 RepID=UPI0025434A79|nr:phosphatidylserine/phosphatidylglycerophosphate/cardiolipin synthase family protein [Bdellovibrio sp. 22V]WII72096.1 phosphatidylserine/phosphatidylglycerophosphate/cardiolipin synthase family protein [Bdellovibrio sp. 22V]
MNVFGFCVFILCSLLISCTNVQRSPSSEMYDDQRINRIQEIDLELSRFWNNDWRKSQELFQTQSSTTQGASHIPAFGEKALRDPQARAALSQLVQERNQHIETMSNKLHLREWSGLGPWFEATFRPVLFEKEEIIEVHNWDDFRLGVGVNPFPLEHRFYKSYSLRFRNMLPPKNPPHFRDDSNKGQEYLKARLTCDAEFIYDDPFLFFSNEKKGRSFDFNWYYNQVNGQKVSVRFSPFVRNCQFYFFDPEKDKTWTHGFALKELSDLSTEWLKLTNQIDVCARPSGDFGNNPTSFFWQQDYNFVTCTQTFDKWVNLRDPYVSMNRKIMSLTGSPLARKDFDNKNPMAKLSFDKAPQFDIIWVSSLNFSADFHGMVLARALRYHASRGTQIRILVPEVTMTKKDKRILEWLQIGMPNVKVQYYKYRLSEKEDGGWLDKFHRVNHTKLIIGHSSKKPSDNFLITGGRNIRDSYIFSDTPFYKAYKYLKNYGEGEEAYIYYNDFEVEIRGAPFVKSVLAQMLSFWMRDPETQRFRSTNINIPQQASSNQVSRLSNLPKLYPLVRHIMSLPYFDGYQLEKFYIEMIDSAQSELLITTPYFRPSVAISAALDRAVQRGVKVKVMTRIRLAGDGTPQIAEDVNKQGVNRHLANVEIYEWSDEKSILHAKLLVIDRKLSFVSSVNLNRRSFIHDTESGVLILHEATANELRSEVLNFLKQGRRITAQEKISWINSTLIDWADSYF